MLKEDGACQITNIHVHETFTLEKIHSISFKKSAKLMKTIYEDNIFYLGLSKPKCTCQLMLIVCRCRWSETWKAPTTAGRTRRPPPPPAALAPGRAACAGETSKHTVLTNGIKSSIKLAHWGQCGFRCRNHHTTGPTAAFKRASVD